MHHLKYTEDYYYENMEHISLASNQREYIKPIIQNLLKSEYANRFSIMGGFPIHILGKLLGVHFPFTDVDLFCFDIDVVYKLKDYFENKGYIASNISANSITMVENTYIVNSATAKVSTTFVVQLIFPRIYDMQQFTSPVIGTLNNFDFTASRVILTPSFTVQAVATDLIDISDKILKPSYSTTPSISRIAKYIRKGFTLSYDMITLIAANINNPDILDTKTY